MRGGPRNDREADEHLATLSEGAAMLVLMRRPGETLVIGDDVAITILGVNRGQVKFGIKAPRRVKVHRQEVFDQIQREKKKDQGGE